MGYGGKSSLLKHVCALGRLFGFPHFSIQNFLGPIEPLNAENPSNGILEVPVTNCNNLSRCSFENLQFYEIIIIALEVIELLYLSIACQNQATTGC